jgi:hypothetical protein
MTTLPALEAALDEAAHRLYGARRRRRWPLVLFPATALAACATALVLALPGRVVDPAQTTPPDPVVPEETLALSTALTRAPDLPEPRLDDPLIAHADLPAVADAFENGTPYPPGHRDTFDWLSTAPGPYDMASVNHARDVRTLVEFRAACIWLRFWLDTDDVARQAAGTVLTDVPDWPTMRGHATNWADVPSQLGDPVALTLQYRNDCSPWRNRQDG